jgi:hypothetical protein
MIYLAISAGGGKWSSPPALKSFSALGGWPALNAARNSRRHQTIRGQHFILLLTGGDRRFQAAGHRRGAINGRTTGDAHMTRTRPSRRVKSTPFDAAEYLEYEKLVVA